ncbi:hypothetical protein E2C01_096976 [Portunus trituberculatus]|uniref:Secreted protein n=1 Tax=Portunus trituberculatus TaxID=210409 RepID=A0A5B7K8R1_PORTR|nr:hypothetical protein [Portunus trituberculatus]
MLRYTQQDILLWCLCFVVTPHTQTATVPQCCTTATKRTSAARCPRGSVKTHTIMTSRLALSRIH